MSEWREVALANVAEIRPSNVDKRSMRGELPVKLCNYMDVYGRDYIANDVPFMDATATDAEIRRFRVEQGDVVLTKDSETPDDIGIPAVVTENVAHLVCGYHLALLKPNRAIVDPIFLAKQLASDKTARYFGTRANGSTRYGLSLSSLAKTKLRLAPLDQQKQVAQILTTLDEAIERTQRLIAKTQQIKAGLMHDLFTRGVLPNGQLRPSREHSESLYQNSPIGWLPKGWRCFRLGAVSEIVSGVTLGPTAPARGIEVPYLRVANVQDGYLDLGEVKTIRVDPRRAEALALRYGDVLMNEGGDFDKLGRGTMWRGEIELCIHQNHVFRVRPRGELLKPEYLAYWSQSEAGRNYFLLSSKQSTNLASINSSQLHRCPLALPSLAEQELIATRVLAVDQRLGVLRKQAAKYTVLKCGLMHDLLTGTVRIQSGRGEMATVGV